MKYKVLFLHGFLNSGQCDMAKALRDSLTDELRKYDDMYAEDEVEVLCPDLPPNPYAALDKIRGIVMEGGVDVVLGNCCGAMYAHIVAAENELPCLVSNPYYNMSKFLQEKVGGRTYKSVREDGNQTVVIDEVLIEEFAKLEKEDIVFRNSEKCKQFVWGIFGEKDGLVIPKEKDGPNKHELQFLKHYSLSFHFPGGHTPTYDETQRYHVPLVACLIREFAYYRKKKQMGESNKDTRYRLAVEYTHEFTQFYIEKMAQLAKTKDFYRCDIDGDFSHIIYRYRPEGKDNPFYVNADGSVMYDFLIEYHRGKPSEGIYYGCKAEILSGDMESHADELRQLWPNIFMNKDKKHCSPLQRELTKILNDTFPWKNFFKCYKPTDNIWEQRYWLYWVTLTDDEEINDVGAVATKIMAKTFMLQFKGELSKEATASTKSPKKRGKGSPKKESDERMDKQKKQYTYYTEAAYERLCQQNCVTIKKNYSKTSAERRPLGKDNIRKLIRFLETTEHLNNGVVKKEGRVISVNTKYEKAWTFIEEDTEEVKYKTEEIKDRLKNLVKEYFKELAEDLKRKNKYNEVTVNYPTELDYLILDKKDTPIYKQH